MWLACLERFYNRWRRHSLLGCLAPAEFEGGGGGLDTNLSMLHAPRKRGKSSVGVRGRWIKRARRWSMSTGREPRDPKAPEASASPYLSSALVAYRLDVRVTAELGPGDSLRLEFPGPWDRYRRLRDDLL